MGHYLFRDPSISLEAQYSKIGQTHPNKRQFTLGDQIHGKFKQLKRQTGLKTRGVGDTHTLEFSRASEPLVDKANIDFVCYTLSNCVNH